MANANEQEVLRQSEEKYRQLFNAIDDGYALFDLIYDATGKPVDLRYLETNPAFERINGFSGTGQKLSEILGYLEPFWYETYDRVVKTGEPTRIEYRTELTGAWYSVFCTRVGGEDSSRVAAIFSDVTDRKRHQQQQDYLITLSEALRSIADPIEIEQTVTRLAMQQFGADRCYYCRIEAGNAIITRDARQRDLPSVAGTYPLSSFALLKRVVDAGQPFVVNDAATTPILDEDIRAICLQLQVISFIDVPVIKNGQAVGVLCTVQSTPRHWSQTEIQLAIDTAERTWAAVERARALEALQEADRRKDEFLAMLAHELRNPMATLHNTLLLLELTQGQDETLPLDRALSMMSREVTHLARMVDDLLDVSRISQGKIHLKKERLDLARLVREALEAARSQFAGKGQVLTSQLPNEAIWVDGDRTRLTQVVRNLLANAAKYTRPGGQISVRLEKETRQAVLRIRDNGIGLAADQLEAIFEVFVQVSSSLDRQQGGLGLGLAVVKQLVELHGGQVGVQSAGLGQGSEFTVRLPLLADVPASMAAGGIGEESVKKAGRILVVDDNADLALTTAMLLRVKTYEAHTCLSGLEALKVVESLQPDAVLLDLSMPGMDGYETCQRLRALDWGRQGIIVALSGYGQEEDKKRTSGSGFDGHLIKPVNLQTLTALLDKLLNAAQSGR